MHAACAAAYQQGEWACDDCTEAIIAWEISQGLDIASQDEVRYDDIRIAEERTLF